MVHESLTTRLLAAKDFIEVAMEVCAVARHQLGIHQTVVMLQALDGRPLLMVDDVPRVTDEQRVMWATELWRRDPHHEAMREHHAPVGEELMSTPDVDRWAREELGYQGDYVHMLLLPLLQPGELLGYIRCGHREGFTPELRRDLTTLSGHVSVRLAQLGVSTLPDPLLERLTPRQRDVARLVARGHTNSDIGHQLDLSENTVKKHLKDIFDLLAIANRTELAAKLQVGPRHDVPVGVSRRGDIAITRTP
jgi:DNA-binding CsgD family transcriptional regulator